MDPAVIGALAFSSFVLALQLWELAIGLLNRRRIAALELQVAESVELAEKRGKTLDEIAKKVDAIPDAAPQKQLLEDLARAVNQLVEAHNAAAAAAPRELNGGLSGSEVRAARTEKEDQRALVAADLKGQLGPVMVELWQRFFPDEWKNALNRPHLALEIFQRLAPQLKARENQVASLSQSNGGGSGRPAPYV